MEPFRTQAGEKKTRRKKPTRVMHASVSRASEKSSPGVTTCRGRNYVPLVPEEEQEAGTRFCIAERTFASARNRVNRRVYETPGKTFGFITGWITYDKLLFPRANSRLTKSFRVWHRTGLEQRPARTFAARFLIVLHRASPTPALHRPFSRDSTAVQLLISLPRILLACDIDFCGPSPPFGGRVPPSNRS